VIFTACPKCERTDFPSRAARDSHVYRCKKNSKSKSIKAEPVKIQDSEHITHPFSDEWDCAVCLHRFSSLESAEEHYKTRHIDKVPYESETAKQSQLEKQVNITEYLNKLANDTADKLSRERFGVVQQQLFYQPEPSPQAPIVESEPSPNTELDSKPQSTAVYDFIKNLFRGKRQSKMPQPELNQVFMANRGVGVDGVAIAWNPKPNYCEKCRVWLYDIEVQEHINLGHNVRRE
jgi:hypothetical protein